MPDSLSVTIFRWLGEQIAAAQTLPQPQPPAFNIAAAFQRIEAHMSAETDALDKVLALVQDDVAHIPDSIKAATAVIQAELDAASAKLSADDATIAANQTEITVDRAALQKATDALNLIHQQLSGGGATVTPTPPVTPEPAPAAPPADTGTVTTEPTTPAPAP